jgi:hypothetical protein
MDRSSIEAANFLPLPFDFRLSTFILVNADLGLEPACMSSRQHRFVPMPDSQIPIPRMKPISFSQRGPDPTTAPLGAPYLRSPRPIPYPFHLPLSHQYYPPLDQEDYLPTNSTIARSTSSG